MVDRLFSPVSASLRSSAFGAFQNKRRVGRVWHKQSRSGQPRAWTVGRAESSRLPGFSTYDRLALGLSCHFQSVYLYPKGPK